jgi:AcrR family transcriptional regulator
MTTPTAGGKITRDAVLAAALQIIDRDRTDALSMRRLDSALNRDPMILYRHPPNKAALLESGRSSGARNSLLQGWRVRRSPAGFPSARGRRSGR